MFGRKKRLEALENELIRLRTEFDVFVSSTHGELEQLKKTHSKSESEEQVTVGQIVNEWVWGKDGDQE
jgi:hypothetical protein